MVDTDDIVDKAGHRLDAGILTSGKWLFFAVVGLSFGVAFFGLVPTASDLITVAMMSSIMVATIGISLFMKYDGRRDRKRNEAHKAEKIELYGTISLLEHYTDRGIMDLDLASLKVTRLNTQFEEILGWNLYTLNTELNDVETIQDYSHGVANLLFKEGHYAIFMHQLIKRINGEDESPIALNNIEMRHKDGVAISVSVRSELVPGSSVLKLFVEDHTERNHRLAVEENIMTLNDLLVNYFSARKSKKRIQIEMEDALKTMRNKLNDK